MRVPRGLQELNVQLSKIVEQLTVELGRSPTIPELAESAGVDEEDVLEALESGRAYTSLSLSQGATIGRAARSSIHSRRSARSSTSTRCPRTGRCSRPGSGRSTSASG